ncbi:Tartrate-resistant acid phosphatase type 5 [Irineochytrium annulatum]|nr:Tartrate-resistant acid phosphatase type 5 [Irineochytrium annulatum]
MIANAVVLLAAAVGYAGAACIHTTPVGYTAPTSVPTSDASSTVVASSTVAPSFTSTTTSATATSTALVKNPTDFSAKGIDFLIIGDWGNQADITDMQNTANYMDKWASANKSDVIMVLGDNFYQGGNFSYEGVQSVDDPKYKVLWEDVYSDYLTSIPWWFILGNHDWYQNTSNTVELTYALSNPRWYEPDYFYTERLSLPNGAHASFIFIETNLIFYGYAGKKAMGANFASAGWTNSAQTIEKQLAYIEAELEKANDDEFVFVMAHHPIFTCGTDAKTANMTQLAAIVTKWKPTAYINGHHHTLSYYVDNAGIMQIGIGSTGNVDAACAPLYNVTGGGEVPNTYGFAHARLDDEAFTMQVITETGQIVFDVKATPRTPVVGVKSDNKFLPPAGDISISWQGKA